MRTALIHRRRVSGEGKLDGLRGGSEEDAVRLMAGRLVDAGVGGEEIFLRPMMVARAEGSACSDGVAVEGFGGADGNL